jgi:release factor glutamine methyltransferase
MAELTNRNGDWTVSSILDWTTGYFERNKINEARVEAEVLLSHVLKCKRLDLYLKKEQVVPKLKLDIYKSYINERKLRKPVSYITGEKEFMGLVFKVDEHTLIPRPETELLVEEALAIIKSCKYDTVVDIGAGSGNISVSIAKLSDIRRVFAVDVSMKALSKCWENAVTNGVASKLYPKSGDCFDALKDEDLEGKVGLLVSNPPYIADDEFDALEPELGFEPRLALFGGSDGLDFYRKIAAQAKTYLANGAHAVFELNSNKSKETADIFEENEYQIVKIIKDYSHLDRILVVKKRY